MTDIREHQPHIVVTIDETTHIISLVDLRLMANSPDTPELVRILSRAIVDLIE